MAAVARDVDHFAPRRGVAHGVEMMHVDAVVELVPEPGEQEVQRAHDGVRVIGRDLHRVVAGAFARSGLALPIPARRRCDRGANRLGVQQCIDDGSPVRQVGSDDHLAHAPEVRAHHARQLAQRNVRMAAGGAGQRCTQRHRRRELHERVTPVQQDRKQAPEAADDDPVFREQHAEPAGLTLRDAPDENRDRHHRDIERRIGPNPCRECSEEFRRAAARPFTRSAWHARHRNHGSVPAHRQLAGGLVR